MILADVGVFRLIDILAADRALSYGLGFAQFCEIDSFTFRLLSEIKVDFEIRRRSELEHRGEGPSHFADESVKRSDLTFR